MLDIIYKETKKNALSIFIFEGEIFFNIFYPKLQKTKNCQFLIKIDYKQK